jgi:hypothetical protein
LVTVSGAIGNNIGTLWLNKTTGAASFAGSVQVSQLRMDALATYDLSFTGASNSFADFYTTTPFITSGSLTLGDSASDTFSIGGKAFNLVVPASGGPASVSLAGTFTTTLATAGAGSISIGGSGVTLAMTDNLVLNSSASNGNITLASAMAGAGKTLTINAGTGSLTISAALTGMGATSFTANEMVWTSAITGSDSLTIKPGSDQSGRWNGRGYRHLRHQQSRARFTGH